MTDWYSMTQGAAGAEIVIYDRIGTGGFLDDGVAAVDFLRELQALAGPITVRLNSPGGAVWDGIAIYNALRDHPAHVTTQIDGLAASIASLIALAGDDVVMADGALFMIHDPYVATQGTAAQMRSAAEMLDRVTSTLVDAYTGRTGMDADTVRAAMAQETWYTAQEAHAAGFVDRVSTGLPVAALTDLTAYGFIHPPQVPTTERHTMTENAPTETAPAAPVNYATTDDVAAIQRQLAAMVDVSAPTPVHPLAAYASLGHYALAVYKGDAEPMNVIADQVTTDNPGVIPPAWVNDVKGIVNLGRPAVTAVGATGVGDSGMSIDWPYFDGDLNALVGVQATEKTDITSVKVSLKKAAANLATYAGGSDISYQLIMRSSPAYVDAYLRIMAAAYAAVTDNAFAGALVAGGTASAHDYDFAGDTDGKGFRAAVFAASVEVEAATGSPASVVLVATDVFLKAGTWDALVPSKYGTQNVPGTAQASTLEVDVSGLPVIHDPHLAAGSIVATNSAAAAWGEDGPRTATADAVTKLGRDVAVWGMGAPLLWVPKGVVKLTNLP
jgi:ATP-dependent protease ClpP protease subunit